MGIDRPVFVIGTGRSGLSPLMDLVSYHPDLAWPSQYHRRFPKRADVAKLSRALEWPLVGDWLRFRRGAPEHDEAWPMWAACYPGFVEPVRDLTASDVTPLVRKRLTKLVLSILDAQKKPRFIAELSGWSRVEFLLEVFPDARFVHIVRDGRAVANSFTNVPYWRGWNGPSRWRWGPLPAELDALHKKYNESFLVLAALQWKLLVRNIHDKTTALPSERFCLVRYEDLVRNPVDEARRVANFAELPLAAPGFDELLCKTASDRIVDANSQTFRIPSWRSNMSDEQIAMLDDVLGPELALFGYQ